jgi:hypothetical protein
MKQLGEIARRQDIRRGAVIAASEGSSEAMRRMAESLGVSPRVVGATQVKAAVADGTSVDEAWGAPLLAEISTAFIESLRSASAFDAMLPSMQVVPLRGRVVSTTTAMVGDLVAEAAPKPVKCARVGGLDRHTDEGELDLWLSRRSCCAARTRQASF